MKPSEVLRKAAQIVDRTHRRQEWLCSLAGCAAIEEAAHGGKACTEFYDDEACIHCQRERAAHKYFNLLKPARMNAEQQATGYWWNVPEDCSAQDNNARVMGLLFAALMAEDNNE
jgi:hypothetical protein